MIKKPYIHETNTCVYPNDEEIDATVFYTYDEGEKGDYMNPSWPPSVGIEDIQDPEGNSIIDDISNEELEDVRQWVLENHDDDGMICFDGD
jgi:phosphomannomutase